MLTEFIIFIFTYTSIHVAVDDQNIVFGNVSYKRRLLIIEGDMYVSLLRLGEL